MKSIFEMKNPQLVNLWEPGEELTNGEAINEFLEAYKTLENKMRTDSKNGWTDKINENILNSDIYNNYIIASDYLIYKVRLLIAQMNNYNLLNDFTKQELIEILKELTK